jgi:hypothetical protein
MRVKTIKHYNILITTPTYNRPLILNKTINKLKKELSKTNYNLLNIILIDGSPSPNILTEYNKLIKYNSDTFTIKFIHHTHNYGRELFYKTYTDLLLATRPFKYDYLYFHADDMLVCDDFFNRSISLFNTIKNTYPIMNLFNNHSSKWKYTNFIDGEFITTSQFPKLINFEIKPIDKSRFINKPLISSGVFQQLTTNLQKYISPNNNLCFTKPVSTYSVMFPNLDRTKKNDNPKINNTINNNQIDVDSIVNWDVSRFT